MTVRSLPSRNRLPPSSSAEEMRPSTRFLAAGDISGPLNRATQHPDFKRGWCTHKSAPDSKPPLTLSFLARSLSSGSHVLVSPIMIADIMREYLRDKEAVKNLPTESAMLDDRTQLQSDSTVELPFTYHRCPAAPKAAPMIEFRARFLLANGR